MEKGGRKENWERMRDHKGEKGRNEGMEGDGNII